MSPYGSIAASEENQKYMETLIDAKISSFKLELEQQRTKLWLRIYWVVIGGITLGGWTVFIWSLAAQ